jgi:hypothetical protein
MKLHPRECPSRLSSQRPLIGYAELGLGMVAAVDTDREAPVRTLEPLGDGLIRASADSSME